MSGIKNIKKKLKGFQVRPPNAEVIKKVLLHIPYMVVFYVVNKCTWLYQYCRGSTVVDRLMVLLMNYNIHSSFFYALLGGSDMRKHERPPIRAEPSE